MVKVKRKLYIAAWVAFLLTYPIGWGSGVLMAAGQDAAGRGYGYLFGALAGVMWAVSFSALITGLTDESIARKAPTRVALRCLPWLLCLLLVGGLTLKSELSRPRLRSDLSATVTYVGAHDAILLDYSDRHGESSNISQRRAVPRVIPSVRVDGRIFIEWGPEGAEKQEAELSVGPSIPKGGAPVVVDITLTDTEASYTIRQERP